MSLFARTWSGSSLRESLARRFLAVLAVALLAGLLATATIYLRTNEAARELQAQELTEHFKARMDDLERGWLVQADMFRGQIEFGRLLESADQSKSRMSAYLASIGGQQIFTHVTLLDAAGRQIYQYRTRSQEYLDIPSGAKGSVAVSWVYGPADRTVYRVIEQSIWMGASGRGRLLVYAPLDNALLQSMAYPGTAVSLRWRDAVVAQSSDAALAEQRRRASGLRAGKTVDVVMPWGNGPELLAAKDHVPPLPLLETLLIVGLTSLLLLILGGQVLARWLAQLVERLQALGGAVDRFGREGALSERVERELALAAAPSTDEVGSLSSNVRRMIHDILKAQAGVREGEEKFTAIFRHSPVSLTVIRAADGRFLDVNAAFLALFGLERDAVIGNTSLQLGLYAAAQDREDLMAKFSADSRVDHAEVVLRTYAGPRLCRISMESVRILGDNCIISSAEDITAQRQMERDIRELNQSLEQRVSERTRELEQSVQTLRLAQDELVRAEKLAALGGLVAGVAHEINTPVGIGVTAASYLDERVKDLAERFKDNTLSRQDMVSFTQDASESTTMVLGNLRRAADLINSFKMVAVDQTSSKRRAFELKPTLEEIMATVRHLVKGEGVRIELDLAEELRMDSYPGPLGQVITNLFNNALIHAFEGRASGCIRIRTQRIGDDGVELSFSDDGMGIAPEHLGRIFDPFFTTKFGQGGSGLGLNIVHNLVTGVLGGRIFVASQPGEGTVFTLTLPLVSPFVEAAPA
ncbi:MAG: ATP-binding protein [Hylemonella sp.]|nr:ATP-binding protein [Hylemonella sp.]